MGALTSRLAVHTLVGLDTAVFIYYRETPNRFSAITREVFEGLERGDFQAVTSVISLLEIAVKPYRTGRPDLADEYDLLLANFPHINLVDVDRSTALKAAELRASYNLRPPDAIQVAACLVHGGTALVTNDSDLRRVTELEVFMLGDFLDSD